LKVKNEKTILLSLWVIFHFVLEPFQPHFFRVGFSQKKEGEKDFGNLFAF